MRSQNDEEEVLKKYFHTTHNGRLLDIGAFDGINLSNSYALVESGWSGVLVEASPTNFTSLVRNYPFMDSIIPVCVAVGNATGLVTFHDSGEMVSSTDIEHVKKWSGSEWIKYHIMMVSAENFNELFPDDFEFINVDVEGYSTELFLELLPLYPSAKCWCVEHDGKIDLIRTAASMVGLKEISSNGENIIIAR